jgi:amidase
VEEWTLVEMARAMESREITARSLTEWYLDRIETLDRAGPALRCVLTTNPDALDTARGLDRERAAGWVRGPLHGVPVLIKDNMATADRMTTTAGSVALEGSVAPRDSRVAARLRAAGAVLLGKANMSEWANFRSSHSSSGWSSRGGQCRNPYALDRSPGGSSSGSGAAPSANLAAAAVGTETDGSIVCPASFCGIVGLKPTVGLVSRAGIIPISDSQDTAGPMGRTVGDVAVVLGALTGEDPADPATAASRGVAHTDYGRFLDFDGLRGAWIGVPRERYWGYSAHTDRIAEQALETMRRLGAEIVDPADVSTAGDLGEPEFEVLLYEFKDGIDRYLASLGPDAPVRSLEDVIAFNVEHADRVMPFFGQDVFERAREKGPLTDAAYRDALAACRRLARTEGLDAVMDAHRLDALVAPTSAPAFVVDPVNGDHVLGGSSSLAAVAGCPAVTVPAGAAFGLPVGMTFFGRAWSEPVLLRLAYAFEHETLARRTPEFLPSAAASGYTGSVWMRRLEERSLERPCASDPRP